METLPLSCAKSCLALRPGHSAMAFERVSLAAASILSLAGATQTHQINN